MQSKIKINGVPSDPFTLIMQEVLQNCLLSIVLHVVATKVLAPFVDNDMELKWRPRNQRRDFAEKHNYFLK